MKEKILLLLAVSVLCLSCTHKSGYKNTGSKKMVASSPAIYSNSRDVMLPRSIFAKYNKAVFMVFTTDGNHQFQGSGFFVNSHGHLFLLFVFASVYSILVDPVHVFFIKCQSRTDMSAGSCCAFFGEKMKFLTGGNDSQTLDVGGHSDGSEEFLHPSDAFIDDLHLVLVGFHVHYVYSELVESVRKVIAYHPCPGSPDRAKACAMCHVIKSAQFMLKAVA